MRGKADFYYSNPGKTRVISWPFAIVARTSHLYMASLSLVIGVIGSLFCGSYSRLGAFLILCIPDIMFVIPYTLEGKGIKTYFSHNIIFICSQAHTTTLGWITLVSATSYRSQNLIEQIGGK